MLIEDMHPVFHILCRACYGGAVNILFDFTHENIGFNDNTNFLISILENQNNKVYLKLFKVKDNTAKIADIGMSKSENLLHGTITGTLVFMAPEVLEGRMYGRSADIFSFAIMMWEMWYGRRVFSESIYSDVITSYPSIKVMLKVYLVTQRYVINYSAIR